MQKKYRLWLAEHGARCIQQFFRRWLLIFDGRIMICRRRRDIINQCYSECNIAKKVTLCMSKRANLMIQMMIDVVCFYLSSFIVSGA